MSEQLHISDSASKAEKYEALIPQIEALTGSEKDLIANLANICAALHQTFGWLWTGFYLIKENELVLGPFQGPVACTRIRFGKGVCGTAWKDAKSILVPDVEQFPGHIACSSLSVAEIVIPVFENTGKVAGVLDIDSDRFNVLDETDVYYLEKISALVTTLLNN
ncbi:MAG TPA: GAF domain-containing protein [Paludibacter sp.]|nr:GAF domain-containing protein [Paludibacter sp.]